MSNLSLRFITTIILLPPFLFLLYANNISLYFLIMLQITPIFQGERQDIPYHF